MKSVVICASRSGNTRLVAGAIADRLRLRGPVQVMSVDEAPATMPAGTDLVIVGGPTEARGMTEPVTRFLDRLAPGALRGIAAVSFDTRVGWPRWLSGSAAAGITRRLCEAGARVIAPEQSFIVSTRPLLQPGELERAEAWAASLADTLDASVSPVSQSGC
jgi:flavodoxin